MGAVTTRVSSFGRVNTTFYSLLKFLNEKDGENLEVCDFGCLDGLHTLPFLKKGYLVDAFDMNEIYLYGGHIQMPIINEDGQVVLQRRTMYGAEDRINIEGLHDGVRLYNKSIFECCNRQYDVVYSKRGLSRKEYSHIPMKRKIEKLKSLVKDDGIMYLEYLMWLDDKNTDNLNPNQYLKQCEMEPYFREGWEILSLVEDRNCIVEDPHIGNPTFHKHRVGMIKVRKEKNYKKEHFNITIKV